MKKISLILAMLFMTLILANTFVFASGDNSQKSNVTVSSEEIDQNENLSPASKTTHKNITSKEEEIQEYTKLRSEGGLGLSRTNATVLYYLHVIQLYSYPVCFVGLAIASLNFFIIGNKKLDKKEQGFSMLVALIIGLIVFQILPLLFAIIVAGR